MENYTITVLGTGVMGTAVVSAILKADFKPYPSKIICCTGSEKLALKLQNTLAKESDIIETSFGAESNKKATAAADVIILGCKPYLVHDVYEQVKDSLTGKQLLVSLTAGLTVEQLQIFSPYVAKLMTNTPAQWGFGMAAVAFSPEAEEKYEDLVMNLAKPVGSAVKIPEKNMAAALSLIGSGPAFYCLMLESVVDGGVKMGLPHDVAREMAIKVMEGTAKMAEITGDHPAVMKSKVCTPGGMTIAGLLKMEDLNVRAGIIRGVEEAGIVGATLGQSKK